MLINGNQEKLENNFNPALGQLRSLEKRLDKDPDLKIRYQSTLTIDQKKGYISELSVEKLERQDVWYLPHHPVVNPKKPEKVRRVCNAARKYKGLCLNDTLMKGPDLLRNLLGILFQFRENKIAITADIQERFLQVEVPNDQRRYLRFLWRISENQLVAMQYNRHIFGAKSSPACANFSLQECARTNEHKIPNAAKKVLENFYVDEMLISVADRETATLLVTDTIEVLKKGGFKLTKWFSSDMNLFENLDIVAADNRKNPKILGIEWISDQDQLTIRRNLEFSTKESWTQRQLLSTVSQVFDPLGFLAQFLIRGRLLMKRFWQLQGQKWDVAIASDINCIFNDWIKELMSHWIIKVPRWYAGITKDNVELHVFGDAS